MHEAVQTARLEPLEARGRERLRGDLEGELGEDERPQGPARHVHALPERVRAEQDARARVAEAPQQLVSLPLPLHEQGPACADLVAHRLRRAPQRPVAREQHEHAPVRCVGELDQHACHGGVVPRLVVPWLGEIGGDPEQALRREIERRRVDLAGLDA